jgi:hypothetical protein
LQHNYIEEELSDDELKVIRDMSALLLSFLKAIMQLQGDKTVIVSFVNNIIRTLLMKMADAKVRSS